jgi:hypothetical protein
VIVVEPFWQAHALEAFSKSADAEMAKNGTRRLFINPLSIASGYLAVRPELSHAIEHQACHALDGIAIFMDGPISTLQKSKECVLL